MARGATQSTLRNRGAAAASEPSDASPSESGLKNSGNSELFFPFFFNTVFGVQE
jgi:hypothetical protein